MKLFLVPAVALATITLAARQFVDCSCSPSNRGYTFAARNELRDKLRDLREEERQLKEDQKQDSTITDTMIANKLTAEAIDLWNGCVNNLSYEECANADAGLRFNNGKYQTSFCKYDRNTWKNGNKQSCRQIGQLSSREPKLINGKPDIPSAQPPTNNNNNKRAPQAAPNGGGNNNAANTPSPGTGDAALPIPQRPAAGTTSTDGDEAAVEINDPDRTTEESTPLPTSRNEGCVAVEHLKGYVLQHARHLRRNVLCAHNFCATPNHAIIVDGEWTSMKHICANKWSCVRSIKMVNNLKLAANRRVVINEHITVTPYDLRFPRWCVWLLQIVEDIAHLLVASVIMSVVAISATVFAAKYHKA